MTVDPIVAAYEARLPERALDDLCDKMMAGESYPARGHDTICLSVILRETDSATLDDMIRTALFEDGTAAAWCYLNYRTEEIVSDYLRDTRWHIQRTAELRQEDEENAEEAAADAKRESER